MSVKQIKISLQHKAVLSCISKMEHNVFRIELLARLTVDEGSMNGEGGVYG